MNNAQIIKRIARESQIPSDRFLNGNINSHEWVKLTTTISQLIEKRLFTADQAKNAFKKFMDRVDNMIAKRALHLCPGCKNGTCDKKRIIDRGTCLMGHVKCSTYEICDQEYHENT